MSENNIKLDRRSQLQPGTLWQRIINQTEFALNCGALLSLPTMYEVMEQDGVQFLVRILANLVRKQAAKAEQDEAARLGKDYNPFLPYEADLFVADLSDTHVCLLNKYNVVEHHILIITRGFEPQERLLTLADFEALWRCLAEVEGLAFYNGGKDAGASQRHKHLQIAPLPLTPNGNSIPIAAIFPSTLPTDEIITLPELPFVHALTGLDPHWLDSAQAATALLECYDALLRSVGLEDSQTAPDGMQSGAYNLLATRQWMLLIPRSQESFAEISVNSLGFAGTLLVRSQPQLDLLKQLSPLSLLNRVAIELS